MSAGIWFWILYVLAFLFGGWFVYGTGNHYYMGGSLVTFVLLGLVGWQVFGPPIQRGPPR